MTNPRCNKWPRIEDSALTATGLKALFKNTPNEEVKKDTENPYLSTLGPRSKSTKRWNDLTVRTSIRIGKHKDRRRMERALNQRKFVDEFKSLPQKIWHYDIDTVIS